MLKGDYTFQHADLDLPRTSRGTYRKASSRISAFSTDSPGSFHVGIFEIIANVNFLEASWRASRSLHGGYFGFGEYIRLFD